MTEITVMRNTAEASEAPDNNAHSDDHLSDEEVDREGNEQSRQVQRWTAAEHQLLEQLIAEHGTSRSWSKIASLIPGRSGKQCRERWLNHLRPDIKKGGWSTEEEDMIAHQHAEFGGMWSKLARLIPGRTENALKNHFNAMWRSKSLASKTNSLLALYVLSARSGLSGMEALAEAKRRLAETAQADLASTDLSLEHGKDGSSGVSLGQRFGGMAKKAEDGAAWKMQQDHCSRGWHQGMGGLMAGSMNQSAQLMKGEMLMGGPGLIQGQLMQHLNQPGDIGGVDMQITQKWQQLVMRHEQQREEQWMLQQQQQMMAKQDPQLSQMHMSLQQQQGWQQQQQQQQLNVEPQFSAQQRNHHLEQLPHGVQLNMQLQQQQQFGQPQFQHPQFQHPQFQQPQFQQQQHEKLHQCMQQQQQPQYQQQQLQPHLQQQQQQQQQQHLLAEQQALLAAFDDNVGNASFEQLLEIHNAAGQNPMGPLVGATDVTLQQTSESHAFAVRLQSGEPQQGNSPLGKVQPVLSSGASQPLFVTARAHEGFESNKECLPGSLQGRDNFSYKLGFHSEPISTPNLNSHVGSPLGASISNLIGSCSGQKRPSDAGSADSESSFKRSSSHRSSSNKSASTNCANTASDIQRVLMSMGNTPGIPAICGGEFPMAEFMMGSNDTALLPLEHHAGGDSQFFNKNGLEQGNADRLKGSGASSPAISGSLSSSLAQGFSQLVFDPSTLAEVVQGSYIGS